MIAYAHGPVGCGGHAGPEAGDAMPRRAANARPGWLMPVVAGGTVVGALVSASVLPPSIALYAAILGACAVMHVLGHGGRGSHEAAGHAAHRTRPAATVGREHGRRGRSRYGPARVGSAGQGPVPRFTWR